ncbi:MAG: DUF3570 domain-containing protein [Gammaproteobacteria bacterium]|nr:DUF3570 domain-containing protein [Gammaproteobacteria bacterium]
MQLKRPARDLRRWLVAASCGLLSASVARAQDGGDASPPADDGPATVVDTALAYYHESDGRVRAIEPIVSVHRDYGDERAANVKLTFDSLSGATPNGAVPSRKAQTFATPSGKSLNATPQTYTTASGNVVVVSAPIYIVGPGQLPMDPNYHDQRLAVNGSYDLPWDRLTRSTFGADLSYEHDFLSASLNASLARDLNDKNTTISAGVNGEFDLVQPIGGSPVPLSDYTLFEKVGNHSKHDLNLVLGATQVMNRHWLTDLSLSADRFSGYLNDPYKIVSLVDPGGNVTGYLYENRPGTRTRGSVFLENRVATDRTSVSLSLRYMTDSWAIHSQTAQLKLRWWNPDHDRYLEPTARWYRQTAASFFSPWISSTTTTPLSYASADQRLGAFHAIRGGLKYSAKWADDTGPDGSELSVRAEWYRQTSDNTFVLPGALQGLNVFPGLSAVLMSFEWRFNW